MKPFFMTEWKKERYVKGGYWGDSRTHDIFNRQALKHPEKIIFKDSKKALSYYKAKRYVDRLALGLLELGFKKDDILVIQLPNIVESALLRLAAPNAGVLALPVMIAFGINEIRHILKMTDARGIVIPWNFKDRDYFQMVQEIRGEVPSLKHIFIVGDNIPDGAISINEMMEKPIEEKYPPDYLSGKKIGVWEVQELNTTTGSTGLPKISEQFHWGEAYARVFVERLRITENDVIPVFIPFPSGIFNCFWITGVAHGCRLVFVERFDPEEALKIIEKEKITLIPGVSTMAEQFLNVPNLEKYDTSSVRIFYPSGGPMPPSLAKELEDKLGWKVVGCYGSMDTAIIFLSSVDDPPELRFNSPGRLFDGAEAKIVNEKGEEVPPGEEGELICRSPFAYSGYYKKPDETLEAYGGDIDGWFRTGDLAKMDKDGYVYIVGRIKDIIKRAGMTISPAEIEDIIRIHPKVNLCAVVGMPDRKYGERVCAFVVLKPGEKLSLEELTSFLSEKGLSTFKLPERLEILDALPMVGDQKIFKRKLVQDITEKLKEEGKL